MSPLHERIGPIVSADCAHPTHAHHKSPSNAPLVRCSFCDQLLECQHPSRWLRGGPPVTGARVQRHCALCGTVLDEDTVARVRSRPASP